MLLKISTLLDKLRAKLDEKGQGMVEYALILAPLPLLPLLLFGVVVVLLMRSQIRVVMISAVL